MSTQNQSVYWLIPAYKPDQELIHLLRKANISTDHQAVILINDGSGPEYEAYFEEAKKLGAIVLTHPKNLGKGQALKTGMAYYLENHAENSMGLVTADADGQHLISDIKKISEALIKDPGSLHLGVRECRGKEVPLRSAFGNGLTKKIYNGLMQAKLRDTQTGLRGLPNSLISHLMDSSASGYEFEFEMLFIAPLHNIEIKQINIQTVYLEQNARSHFRPLLDSMKIYSVFLRFCATSILSFFLDYGLFVTLYYFSNSLPLSVFGARFISVIFNFSINKNRVFHFQYGTGKPFLKYATLASILALSSFTFLKASLVLDLNPYTSKIFIDLFLFVFSFMIQRLFVFKTMQKVSVSWPPSTP